MPENTCSVRICQEGENFIQLLILNLSDSFLRLKKGTDIGVLVDVEKTNSHDMGTTGEMPNDIKVRRLVQSEKFKDIPKCFPARDSKHFSDITNTMEPHIKELFVESSKHLTIHESLQVADLLTEFSDTFSRDDYDIGFFPGIKHKINLTSDVPIRQKLRPTPFHFQQEEEAVLTKMLDTGVVRPSASDYASPVVLVRKKDGGVRWTVDFRLLNNITIKDAFPLPRISECLDMLAGSQFYSCMDLSQGYHQIGIEESDIAKTAFLTKFGLFEYVKMAQGLCNSPSTFQRVIQLVLRKVLWKTTSAYLDDCTVVGKNFPDALSNVREVLGLFRQNNL